MKTNESANNNGPFHKMEYHTYQLKREKSFGAVVRRLPSSTECEETKRAIEGTGHKVNGFIIFKKKKKTTNGIKETKCFPPFYADLALSENNMKLKLCFIVKYIWSHQCINWQLLGHTKNFCHRQPKCVKCAENPHTKKCDKPRSNEPTCALCGKKGHTANYKGVQFCKRKRSHVLTQYCLLIGLSNNFKTVNSNSN